MKPRGSSVLKALPTAIRVFLRTEAAGGFILLACAVAALIVANGGWGKTYNEILESHAVLALTAGAGKFEIDLSIQDWVKDGLMTIFFFVVGLELKRELVQGELSDPASVVLPISAALGGMIVPAVIYFTINFGGHSGGWPIPVATDIAFAVAALSVMGRNAPSSLRIFLLTLAIVDDLGAVVLIALVFSHGISWVPLLATALILAVMALLARWRSVPTWFYVVGTIAVWLFALKSGVHTSVAGVAAAFTVPLHPRSGDRPSVLAQLEHAIHPISAYFVLPVFAFVAAGVPLGGLTLQDIVSNVPVGIAIGLILGKPAGVLAACFFVTRMKFAKMPTGATPMEMIGVACLCGIGFTMSLFLAALAFHTEPLAQAEARIGVLAGSIGATLLASVFFALSRGPKMQDIKP